MENEYYILIQTILIILVSATSYTVGKNRSNKELYNLKLKYQKRQIDLDELEKKVKELIK